MLHGLFEVFYVACILETTITPLSLRRKRFLLQLVPFKYIVIELVCFCIHSSAYIFIGITRGLAGGVTLFWDIYPGSIITVMKRSIDGIGKKRFSSLRSTCSLPECYKDIMSLAVMPSVRFRSRSSSNPKCSLNHA